jgi:hypothetical protein
MSPESSPQVLPPGGGHPQLPQSEVMSLHLGLEPALHYAHNPIVPQFMILCVLPNFLLRL